MGDTFWETRLQKTEELITIYEAAINAVGVGGIQMYKLDTGQSIQTVNYLNLTELQNTLDRLYNRRATLMARCNGGSTHVVPAW